MCHKTHHFNVYNKVDFQIASFFFFLNHTAGWKVQSVLPCWHNHKHLVWLTWWAGVCARMRACTCVCYYTNKEAPGRTLLLCPLLGYPDSAKQTRHLSILSSPERYKAGAVRVSQDFRSHSVHNKLRSHVQETSHDSVQPAKSSTQQLLRLCAPCR